MALTAGGVDLPEEVSGTRSAAAWRAAAPETVRAAAEQELELARTLPAREPRRMDRCPPATKAWPLAGAGRVGEDGTVESLARLAPETELRRWFSWQWYWADSLVDDLIGQGQLRRIDGHVTVASRSRPREAPQRPAASPNPA